MIKQNRWHPDTCDCEIDYTWDTEVPAEDRVHTVVSIVPCMHHQKEELATIEDNYEAVNLENKTKNITIGQIVKAFPDLKPDEIEWSFDEDRNLVIDTSKFDLAKADQIEAIVAAVDVK